MSSTKISALLCIICVSLTCSAFAAERPKPVNAKPAAVEQPTVKPAPAVVPVTILSIIPAQAEPDARVVLSGGGFGESVTVFLGSTEIPARLIDGTQVDFTVPAQLDAGLYALYLKRSDGVIGKSYNFSVLPVRPVLKSLQPAAISSCAAGREREVTARGSNFTDASLLFFDGAAIGSALLSPETISFTVPNVAGGLHQIQVKNSPENSSVPQTLVVETKPEISQTTIGAEYVNYYELIITGKNFTQNSSVHVDGLQIGGRGGQDLSEREKLIYVDCTKLIYQRHPYSTVKKDFRLQVVNGSGEASRMITVTAP
jgi:hypothetical protein